MGVSDQVRLQLRVPVLRLFLPGQQEGQDVHSHSNCALMQILGLIIMLIIMDIIFFVFVPGSWMTYQENNTVWNNLRGLHGFAIFLSVIIFLLKVLAALPSCPSSTSSSCIASSSRPSEDSILLSFPFWLFITIFVPHLFRICSAFVVLLWNSISVALFAVINRIIQIMRCNDIKTNNFAECSMHV